MTKDEKKLVQFQIDEISDHMSDRDFQRDFFESLKDQWEEREWLSGPQQESLGKIYERVTK